MGDLPKGEYFYQDLSTTEDLHSLARDMHPDDIKELVAGGFLTANSRGRAGYKERITCLERCVANSVKTYAIRCSATERTMAIGGYTESGNCWFISAVWLMGFGPEERKELRDLLMQNLMNTLKLFPVLSNAAWAKNTQHLRLIESCGGRIGTSGYIPNGEEFVYFEFRREDYPQLN